MRTYKEVADILVPEEYRSQLWSKVRDALVDVAPKEIALEAIRGIDAAKAENLQHEIARTVMKFSQSFFAILRKSFGFVQAAELDIFLYALLRERLTQRTYTLIGLALDRQAPAKKPREPLKEGWASVLSETELDSIKTDLQNPRTFNQSEFDEAYGDIVSAVACLGCQQFLCVGMRSKERQTRPPDQAAWMLYLQMLQRFDHNYQELESAMSQVGDLIGEIGEAREDLLPGGIHGKTSSILLIQPMSWPQARAHLEEHFSELPRGVSLPTTQPQNWEWLCENSTQLLIAHDFALMHQGTTLSEYRIRQLNALTRCLRPFFDEPDSVVADQRLSCKVVAIELEPPLAAKICPFLVEDGYLSEIRQRPVSHEFEVAHWPILNSADLLQLEEARFPECYAWLCSDAQPAHAARRALDCYATAISIGGRHGSVSPLVEDAWKTVALWTCLETLYCANSKGEKRELIEARFESVGRKVFGSSAAVDHQRGVLRIAYDRRNDAVHSGSFEWDAAKVEEFEECVRALLGYEIMRAAGVDATS